jgi:hypothetical protein
MPCPNFKHEPSRRGTVVLTTETGGINNLAVKPAYTLNAHVLRHCSPKGVVILVVSSASLGLHIALGADVGDAAGRASRIGQVFSVQRNEGGYFAGRRVARSGASGHIQEHFLW